MWQGGGDTLTIIGLQGLAYRIALACLAKKLPHNLKTYRLLTLPPRRKAQAGHANRNLISNK